MQTSDSKDANIKPKRKGMISNLRPYTKGQSGNLSGRPKRIGFIGEIIREHLQEPLLNGAWKGHPRLVEAITRLYDEELPTYFAYGFGKPIETQIQLDGNEAGREMAKAIAREMIAAEGQDSGQANKTPVIES